MNKLLITLWKITKDYGLIWILKRLWYEAQIRSGYLRLRNLKRYWRKNELSHWLLPGIPIEPKTYSEYRRQNTPMFFFKSEDRKVYSKLLYDLLGEIGCQDLITDANQIKKGFWCYFSGLRGDLGVVPDWNKNPFTNQCTSHSDHWSQIPSYSSKTGDIKFIWEAGRFIPAYTLARAYWLSGDVGYAETFWGLVESWRDANPPHHGAHWKCGQETALRLMSWCFALYAFADSPASTPERLVMITGMIAVQANRVERNHIYAQLQGNNHAISEGMGLWTVGLLFPEFKHSSKWLDTGRKILESEAVRQISDDGAYIQQSTNYHRLMLQIYLWAIRLGEVNGNVLSPALYKRVQHAGKFLYQLQDEVSGSVPNYGANDGALILPINNCDYRDFRPVLASVHYLFNKTLLYQSGTWAEDLLWLFGPKSLQAKFAAPERTSWAAPVGGYYTLRGNKSWAMIRCARLRDRPSQADMLHLDIWRDGINLACDPGTYRYYADSPWNNGLSTTRVHNTISVDGFDQMERGPHFLWFDWTQAHLYQHIEIKEQRIAYFEGIHEGYARLKEPVFHRRAVLMVHDLWIVIDDLIGESRHNLWLHWLLADVPFMIDQEHKQVTLKLGEENYGLRIFVPGIDQEKSKFDVVRGTERSAPRGWQSSHYGVRNPAISVGIFVDAQLPIRLVSLFAPDELRNNCTLSEERLLIKTADFELNVMLHSKKNSGIVQEVKINERGGQTHQYFV